MKASGGYSAPFVSNDPRMLDILALVRQVADTNATVLLTGESGTGKEIIAHILHDKSARHNNPFVAVNCGAVPETLQESELFGHVKGAFSGAMTDHIGKFAAADGGTIFLDEIGEMGLAFQVKMLRILQSGEYTPVGGSTSRFCNVRVVAATNQNLDKLIGDKTFRQDLFYRLDVIHLNIPPLRQRKQDIPLLIEHFLSMFRASYNKPDVGMDPETVQLLMSYDFPGNVRELENIIRRCVILCNDEKITPRLLPSLLQAHFSAPPLLLQNFFQARAQAMEDFERNYLIDLLRQFGGIICRAAKHSGLSERNFHEKLKKYAIQGKDFRPNQPPQNHPE